MMKTALKLVLLDLLLAQVVAPVLMVIPFACYLWVTTGGVDEAVLMRQILIPAQLAGLLLMAAYLWMRGYVSKQRDTWQPTSVSFLFYSGIATFTIGFWVSALMEQLDWIPNLMEQSFDILQSGWGGIVAIALLGPIVEELLFRGAIFQALLKDYSPMKAILLSSFLFAVFHLNPAQMIPAFLMGVLLAWACYKTRSLIPSMWMHILNNSLAVCLSICFPEMEQVSDLTRSGVSDGLLLGITGLFFLLSVWKMNSYSFIGRQK